jgi:hypothetical protein
VVTFNSITLFSEIVPCLCQCFVLRSWEYLPIHVSFYAVMKKIGQQFLLFWWFFLPFLSPFSSWTDIRQSCNIEFLKENFIYSSWVLRIFYSNQPFFLLSFKLNIFIGFILESIYFYKCDRFGKKNVYMWCGGEVMDLEWWMTNKFWSSNLFHHISYDCKSTSCVCLLAFASLSSIDMLILRYLFEMLYSVIS